MNKSLGIAVKKKLRDPIWQSIGVFLTFITLITSLFVGNLIFRTTPPGPNRLIFSSETSKDLTDFPEPVSKRMQIFVDGKEERHLRLFIFRLEYKGEHPVRSVDFEVPIVAKIPNTRKLVAVQRAPNLEGPTRFNKQTGRLDRDDRPPINFEVEFRDQHTFEIKPLLMNPGDWLGIEIYTAAVEPQNYSAPKDSTEKYKELTSEIKWSCHVANVDCPGKIDLSRDFDYAGFNEPSFLQIYVIHQGWAVYFIVIFTIVNLIVFVLLARTAGLQKIAPTIQLILFSLAIASSLASAEILANWLLPYRMFGALLFEETPVFAWILFWLNLGIIMLLAALTFRNKKRRTVSRPRKAKP